jgi:hypothetical protein
MGRFSMLVDIEISFLSGRLAEATHIFQQTSLRGLYRIFFVPTDGLVHKLKMAIYFNSQSERGGFDVDRCGEPCYTM